MYLNNYNIFIIIGVDQETDWCRFGKWISIDLKLTTLDSNNKYVFKQS